MAQRQKIAAINLVILAVVMLILGIANGSAPPILTAIGFAFIAWAFSASGPKAPAQADQRDAS